GHGQAAEVAEAGLLGRLQAEIVVALAPNLEGLARLEAIEGHGGFSQRPMLKPVLKPMRDQKRPPRRAPGRASRRGPGRPPRWSPRIRMTSEDEHNMFAQVLRAAGFFGPAQHSLKSAADIPRRRLPRPAAR